MGKFLIQTINGQVRHDWSLALMESIDYQNWLHKGSHEYELCEFDEILNYDYFNYIPSGTIQFVSQFIKYYRGENNDAIKPINIPHDLRKADYLKRLAMWKTKEEIIQMHGKTDVTGKCFIKSDDTLKGYAEVTSTEDAWKLKDNGNYIVSQLVDVDSEWRSFVFNGELVGIQNYLGDFTMMPDIQLIKQMIDDYKDCPPAYSLDVMVNRVEGTMLLEVHNLYSCGFYGFSRNDIIPQMIARSFNHLLQKGW